MATTFNGTTDKLTLVAAPPVITYPMTFAAWFNKNALTFASAITEVDTNGADFGLNLMYVDPSANALALSISAANVASQASKGTYTTGNWFHACAVYQSTSSRQVYLNGSVSVSDNTLIPLPTFTREMIGRVFDGRVAEVGIWNAVLTVTDIGVLQKFSPRHVRPQNLKSYSRLIRNTQNLIAGPLTATGTTPGTHPRIIY